MIVTTAVGRVFDHFAKVELTLPPDQLPWRSGPVVRGLRLLPVRYELSRNRPRTPVPGPRADASTDTGRGADTQARGLLSALRRMMSGGKRPGQSGPRPSRNPGAGRTARLRAVS